MTAEIPLIRQFFEHPLLPGRRRVDRVERKH
jgi:hypothetical protein